MSPHEFSKLRDGDTGDSEQLLNAIFDEAHDKWSEEGSGSLTEGQLTVLVVQTYFEEVLNGGFYQYFSNETGGLGARTPDALRRVGMNEYVAILERFLNLFPNGQPSEDSDIRQVQLDAIEDEHDEQFFEQLEKPFWDLCRNDKIGYRQKFSNYIVSNEDEFVGE